MKKFNYSSKPAHPRKIQHLMEEFMNEILTSAHIERYAAVRKGHDGFKTFPYDNDTPIIVIEYDFNDMACNNKASKFFLEYFYSICPWAEIEKVSEVTISLLHELGHNLTAHKLPKNFNKDEENYLLESQNLPLSQHCMKYFQMKDEKLATNWAVKWISQKENIKIIKDFEKKFFKAWRG